jgi:phage terminase large subunit GpA-like protein
VFTSTPEALEAFHADLVAVDRAALKPTPKLNLVEWSERYRRLTTGAIGGPWQTWRYEIARGPMMAVTEPGVSTITVKCCTQTMKTELLLNTIGYYCHQDPCPILLAQPKDDLAKAFSKERLAPMVRASPALRDLLGDQRTRRADDTLLFKGFPGGFLAMVSAGSPSNLAMRPIRVTLADEIDKYETTKEGDPVMLLEERTATFKRNRLRVRCCSPTTEGFSRVHKSYLSGDQRKAFVRCPHCDYEQTLDFFRHVHWGKSEEGEHFPSTAAIRCENCGEEWSEAERLRIVTTKGAIRWFQTATFECCGERQEPMKKRRWKWSEKYQIGRACCVHCGKFTIPNDHASFQASKLYSPDITIPQLAAAWLAAKDDPESKQTFYNTQLGEAFAAQALKRVESHSLTSRREQYMASVPRGVLVLVAGLDVQPGSSVNLGRVEIEVVGWGLGEESWSIAHEVFMGDPARSELWKDVDQFLLKGFDYEGGGEMRIRAACVDSGGHNTQDVYAFTRARVSRNVWAVKGAAERGGQWSPVWPIPKLEPQRSRRTGYKPIILGVNAAKESIRQKLLVEEPGPGYCHFPIRRPDAWFDQLTSETLMVETKGGFNVRKWVLPRGRANEALDCRVYAYAALCGLYAVRKVNLARIAELLETFKPDGGPDKSKPSGPAPGKTPRRSNFVG